MEGQSCGATTHIQGLKVRIDRRIWLIILSILAVLWLQAPRIGDRFQVDEDFRLYYWMHKFQDPQLFPHDGLKYGYIEARLPWGKLPLSSYSPGYGLLFYPASFLAGPVLLSKLLPFLLAGATTWYLSKWGESLQDRSTGVVLPTGFMFLNLASPTSLSVIPGLHRSFSCPLIIAFLYYLDRRKYVAAAIVTVVSALIYIPGFVLMTATWGLSILKLKRSDQLEVSINAKGFGLLVVALLLGALVLYPFVLSEAVGSAAEIPNSSSDEASHSSGPLLWHGPKHQPGSRYPLFTLFPVIGAGGLVTKSFNALHVLVLLCLSAMFFLILGRSDLHLPRPIGCMLLASMILFILDWVIALLLDSFLLYLPSRYTRVGLFLFFSIFVSLNVSGAVKEAVRLIHRGRRGLVWLIGGVEILVLSLILIYPSNRTVFLGLNMKWLLAPASLLLGLLYVANVRKSSPSPTSSRLSKTTTRRVLIGAFIALCLVGWGAYARKIASFSGLHPPSEERELLDFLQTLPKDVLLAGTPCALDNVPLFAKRQILFSCEQISQDEDLMREALDAYYAEDTQAILSFCQAQEVDYLVIDRQTYTEEYLDKGWIFFEPYNQELLPRIRARDAFALAHISDEAKVFKSRDFFVVPCTRSALEK